MSRRVRGAFSGGRGGRVRDWRDKLDGVLIQFGLFVLSRKYGISATAPEVVDGVRVCLPLRLLWERETVCELGSMCTAWGSRRRLEELEAGWVGKKINHRSGLPLALCVRVSVVSAGNV